MIEAGYVRTMARYNAWQNKQLKPILEALDEDSLRQDRGAFFGSIMKTLSHLLWGDTIWMSRFYDKVSAPDPSIDGSTSFVADLAAWNAARFPLDGHMNAWAKTLKTIDLRGTIDWYSFAAEKQMSMPKDICVVQLFNHQTHHRGQIHAMLTAAGHKAPVTDVPFMPKD